MENKQPHKEQPQEHGDNEQKLANENFPDKDKMQRKNDTDTEPDEFISPNADTDQPLDRHVSNDAVLSGEDNTNYRIDNLPDNKKEQGKPQKKDIDKSGL
jgi:hypothetical protein